MEQKRSRYSYNLCETTIYGFDYKGKRYSVTYYNDNRPDYISFAEFYKRPIDVKSIDELLKVKIGSFSLEQVIGSLPDSAFDIY